MAIHDPSPDTIRTLKTTLDKLLADHPHKMNECEECFAIRRAVYAFADRMNILPELQK